MIYEVWVSESHKWLFLDDSEYGLLLRKSKVPLLDSWVPPRGEVGERKDRWADLPWYGDGTLVASPKAKMLLNAGLSPLGEWLPTDTKDGFYIFHPLTFLDCIDWEKSNVEYMPSGKISGIYDYVLRPEIEYPSIFRAVGYDSVLFIRDDILEIIRSNNLKGLTFKPVKIGDTI